MLRKTILIFTGATCIILCGLLSGCRSSKQTAERPTSETQIRRYPATPDGELRQLIDSYREWSDVTMSVKCNLRSPKNLSVSGKATMIRGSEIKLSLRMLGFEVAALYADRDSIYIYEKLGHTMIAEAMSRVTSLTGLDLNGVQDMLLGQLTNPDNRENILSGFKTQATDNTITLTLRKKNYDLLYTLARGTGLTLSAVDVTAGSRGEAVCRYAPPLITEAGPVSPTASLSAKFGKQSLEASLNWSLETASWNKNLKPDKNIPKGYQRISADKLLKALGSF